MKLGQINANGIRSMAAKLAAILIAAEAGGAEVGRALNFSDRGTATYIESDLTSPQYDDSSDYSLPPIAPDVPNAAAKGGSSFFAQQIEVEGVTVFAAQEVSEFTRPYEGRVLNIEDVSELRLKLSEAYLRAGYVNSGVLVPDQDVASGTLVLKAVEGELSDVALRSGSGLRWGYIENRIKRRLDDPLNITDVRIALEHLQRDPMVRRIDAQLVPGDEPGQGVLALAVESADKFRIEAVADNHRATSVGEERGRIAISVNNLTGLGESLRLSHTESEGGDSQFASFSLPIGFGGLLWNAYYSQADSEVIDEDFGALDITNEISTLGTTLSYPVIDTLQHRVSLSAGFESKEADSQLLGLPFSFSPGAVDGESDTRSLLVGLDWSVRRPTRVIALRGTYRRGLDVGGATIFDPEPGDLLAELQNPTGADGRFETYLFQGLFIQRLNVFPELAHLADRAQLVVRGTLQRATQPLMSLEKVSIGGANTVRGFRENLLVRDNGSALTIELQLPVWGYNATPHWRNLIVAPFVDVGSSWDEADVDQSSSQRDTSDRRNIASAGIGLLWNPYPGLRAEFYWGEDVGNNFEQGDPQLVPVANSLQNDGIHLSISYGISF